MNATTQESSAGRTQDAERANGQVPETPGAAFADAKGHFNELLAYVAQYVGAKIGGIRTSIRNLVIYAILGVVALIAGGAMIVTAASIVIIGLAQAIGQLLGGRIWAGNLIVGVLFLAAIALATMFAIKKIFNSSRESTIKTHERRLKQQRVTLGGHDARQRSAEYITEQH